MRVIDGIPLGHPLSLTVTAGNSVQTLQASKRIAGTRAPPPPYLSGGGYQFQPVADISNLATARRLPSHQHTGMQDRATHYMADEDCTFTYVGLENKPNPWLPEVRCAFLDQSVAASAVVRVHGGGV
jgi:hypothetical protein